MFSKLRKFISWAFLKVLFGGFVLVGSCALYAFWLERADGPDFGSVRPRYLAGLRERLQVAQGAREVAAAELAVLRGEAAGHLARAEKAAGIATSLEELQTFWRRQVTHREQSRLNARGIERMRQIEQEERELVGKLGRPLAQATARFEKTSRAEARLAEELGFAEEHGALPGVHYLHRSWRAGWWVFCGLAALYFLGPTVHALAMFYVFAPHVAGRKPLRLDGRSGYSPTLGESRTVVETSLWPGESARVRLRYLKSVEEGVMQSSTFMMSWRFPVLSLLSGFLHDVNLKNARAGRDYRLAFAHHKHPDHQMAVVHVPEAGSLVVRPSFLASVVLPPGQKLQVRRRWRLLRWQAWITGQLCFHEFVGSCRLVVAGRPGLRAERLVAGEDGALAECRTGMDRIIGFTPGLEYRLIRTPRFWRYYLGDARLFDAHFRGVGFVLIQNHLPGKTPGLLSVTRNRARKLIGL